MRRLKIEDFIGKKFGRLEIMEFFIKNRVTWCIAKCECSTVKEYRFNSLKVVLTKSCGCIRIEKPNSLKYRYNEEFFEKESDNLHYILGLLYTDGCIVKSGFSLMLKKSDSEVLRKIAFIVKNDDTLYLQKGRKFPGSNNLGENLYILRCISPKIKQILSTYGLYERKTNSISPIASLRDSSNFWRGCIDGDGWVSYRNNQLTIGFGGTKEMCEGLRHYFSKFVEIKSKLFKRTDKNYYEFSISGKKAVVLHNLLYNDSELFIERKKFYNAFENSKAINRNLDKERKELEK